MFGVVVCHYFRPDHPPSTKAAVRLSLSLLKQCTEVSSIVLSDGSPDRDPELKAFCEDLGVRYVHFGMEISFAQTYNLGARFLLEDWIALMASDVFVYHNTFTAFKNFIGSHSDLNLGCLIPFLSNSDLLAQTHTFESVEVSCRVPVMTLNLNLMKRSVFDRIGGVPRQFSGAYNDIVMAIKMHDIGLDIFMVKGAVACHYGRMTISSGTSYRYKSDKATFQKEFSRYVKPGTRWGVRMDPLVRRNPFHFVSDFFEENAPPAPDFLKWLAYMVRLRLIYKFQRVP